MATVYLAHDVKHDRQVALKVLKPELGAVLGAERFLAEIKVTANLQHPNLLPLFDSGDADGLLFYVMPYIEGETLRAKMEREPQLALNDTVRVVELIAGALDFAHARGVVHRDLKPENILLQAGQPIVADFGIALAVRNAGGERITQTGLSLGTPHYMSPEQAAGDRAVDARSDQYALAALTYEMLTGEPPHTGATAQVIIARLLTETPRSLTSVRPALPTAVDAAVQRALAKTPGDRFASCGAFAAALLAGSTGATEATNAALVRQSHRVSKTRSRTTIAVGGLLTVAAAAWFMLGRNPSASAPVTTSAKSIAILPLINVGGDSAQEYFADGMADELATALGTLPGLRVAARSSSYAYKGRRDLDVRDIGQRLGVDVVLQGSVRRAADRLRVSVQLTDAKAGVELWSHTYDEDARDVFAVQDSITQATVRQLALSLGAGDLASTRMGRTANVEAHDLYLRAQTIALQGTESALRQALVLYRKALTIDPTYAQADAAMAYVYESLADSFMPANVAYDSSRTAARRALARDSLLPDARGLAAFASMALEWDFENGERELRAAVARDPKSVHLQILFSVYLCLAGREGEGRTAAMLAMAGDPLNPVASWSKEQCLYFSRKYDQLIAEHAATSAQWPDARFMYWESYLAAAYREKGLYPEALAEYERAQQGAGDKPLFGYAVTLARAGRTADARAMLERLLAYGRTHYVNPIQVALIYASLGENDQAFAWFDRTLTDRTGWLWALARFPELDKLRKDSRYDRLIKRIGLPASVTAAR